MATKNEIEQEATKEGFAFTNQALNLMNGRKIEDVRKLIDLAKQRKFIIAGGDVMRFLNQGQIPTSLINSDDLDMEKRLQRIELLLSNIQQKVK